MSVYMSKLSFSNPLDNELKPIEISFVPINLGSVHLNITKDICERLQLREIDEKQINNEFGLRKFVPYVGPILINYSQNFCCTGAIVTEGLSIGTIILDDLNIKIFPNTNTLTPNTE